MKKIILFLLSINFYNCITLPTSYSIQIHKYINAEEEKVSLGFDNEIKSIYLNSEENNLILEHLNPKFGTLYSEFVNKNNETIDNFSMDLVKKNLNYSVKKIEPSGLILSPSNDFYLKIFFSRVIDNNGLVFMDLEKLEIKKIQYRGGIAKFKLKGRDSFFERRVNIFKIVLKNNKEIYYCNEANDISRCEVKTKEQFDDLEINFLNENFFYIYGEEQLIFIKENIPEKLKSVLRKRDYSFGYPNKSKSLLFYHSKKILYLTLPITITADLVRDVVYILRGFFL